MESFKSLAKRQAIRFGRWMISPKTLKGGLGRLVIAGMIISTPGQMLSALTGGNSQRDLKAPEVEQVQPSPAVPVASSPAASPLSSPEIYDVKVQVNTIDGDKTPQDAELKVDSNGAYTITVPFQGMDYQDNIRWQARVYEFSLNNKTLLQYCEDCIIKVKRGELDSEPIVIDSVTADGFSITPKILADDGVRNFYVIKLVTGLKEAETPWKNFLTTKEAIATDNPAPPPGQPNYSDPSHPHHGQWLNNQRNQAIAAAREGKNAVVYDPPSNCRASASKDAAVVKVFDQKTYITVDLSSRTSDGWVLETSGCAIHESQFEVLEAGEPEPEPEPSPESESSPAPAADRTQPVNTMPSFASCKDAKAAGYSNFPTTPGNQFDRDGDGIGCES
jgi:Excalibur calcium-binding domain